MPSSSSFRRVASTAESLHPPPAACAQSVKCEEQLTLDEGPVCARCSARVGPNLVTTSGCSRCSRDRFAFDRAVALGTYRGSLKSACLQAKNDSTGLLARRLAQLLAHRWHEVLTPEQFDLIVPVPAHWSSRLMRSSLPTDHLAASLARETGIRWTPHVLRKTRRTPAQSSLPATRRRENLKRAFRLAAGVRLNGGSILLVDDILTTGTTAHRAALALREGGADRVAVAVVARGIGE